MLEKLIITKIEKQQKRERCNIWINGAYSFSIFQANLLRLDLKNGQALTKTEIEEIKKKDNFWRIYQRALLILSYRAQAREELRRKLLKYFEVPLIEEVIKRLEEEKLINDQEFVQEYISQSKKGKKAIRHDLLKKGVDKETIERGLNSLSLADEIERAKLILKKMRLEKPLGEKMRLKVMRRLQSKGFSYEVIKSVVK